MSSSRAAANSWSDPGRDVIGPMRPLKDRRALLCVGRPDGSSSNSRRHPCPLTTEPPRRPKVAQKPSRRATTGKNGSVQSEGQTALPTLQIELYRRGIFIDLCMRIVMAMREVVGVTLTGAGLWSANCRYYQGKHGSVKQNRLCAPATDD